MCIRIYHQQFGLCLMAMNFLFLNPRTILLCVLTKNPVFLQTAKKSSHQLQELQTICQAQNSPIIRSQKASSVTSSGISNFQKEEQNFWHQGYNSRIYYTTLPLRIKLGLKKNFVNALDVKGPAFTYLCGKFPSFTFEKVKQKCLWVIKSDNFLKSSKLKQC